jgi:hypothetical protein
VLALIAIAAGSAAGLALSARLINLGGRASGLGSGIGSPPSAGAVAAMAAAALASSVLAAVVLARRAARVPVATVLGP